MGSAPALHSASGLPLAPWDPCAVPGRFWGLPQNVVPQPGDPRPAQRKNPEEKTVPRNVIYATERSIPFLPKVSRIRGGVTQPGLGSPHGASFSSSSEQEGAGGAAGPGSPIPGSGCTDSPQVTHCPYELKMELPRASDSCRGRIQLLFRAFFTPQSWS